MLHQRSSSTPELHVKSILSSHKVPDDQQEAEDHIYIFDASKGHVETMRERCEQAAVVHGKPKSACVAVVLVARIKAVTGYFREFMFLLQLVWFAVSIHNNTHLEKNLGFCYYQRKLASSDGMYLKN